MFEKSSINMAVNSVYKTLQSRLIKLYNITDVDDSYKLADDILKVHGLDKERFSIISQIEQFFSSPLNACSIDDNSNKNDKTIKGVLRESESPIDKMVGYRFLYRKLVEIYGKKEAKYLTGLMYDFTLALADSTNILIPYCWSFDASKLITQGKPFGQLPSAPVKRLDSYVSLLNEVIHQMSNHLAGAIAIGTFFLDVANLLMVKEHKTIDDLKNPEFRKYIQNQYQRVVHGLNSLSRNGGVESPFTNISLFDRPKLRKLLSEYAWMYEGIIDLEHPEEGTEKVVEFIIELQNIYMNFFDKGDPKNGGLPYRFPVSTINLSKCTGKQGTDAIEDKSFLKSICKKDIYRYNLFVSEGNKIASCCFHKDQKVLARDSVHGEFITDFKSLIAAPKINNTTIYHNGFWKHFKKVCVPYTDKMIKITTANNKSVMVTKDHKFPCLYGNKIASELTTDDYLMFSTKQAAKTQKHEALSYEQGFLIGCFLGDGSYVSVDSGTTIDYWGINLSLNKFCVSDIKTTIDKALTQWGILKESKIGNIQHNVYPLLVHSKKLANILLQYVPHNIANNKYFNEILLGDSPECKRGMLDGWYATDGGNSNRCYSTSPKLVYQMETLCATLGIQSVIDISDRTDEKVVIRDIEYDRNYPLYCFRFYENTHKSKDINYKWHNNSIFFKIQDIELIDNDDEDKSVYCVEIIDDEPYFTLANGIITHNCRLLNDTDLLDLASQVNSFGAGGSVSLGSHRVITINFARLALLAKTQEEYVTLINKSVVNCKKILFAHKSMLKDFKDYQLFLKLDWIQLDRLFSTIGILGYVEADYILKSKGIFAETDDVVVKTLQVLKDAVNSNNEPYPGCIFNTEQIPAESMSHRLAKVDAMLFGGDKQPFQIYANQFVPLWETNTSVWEKMRRDGLCISLMTGGGISHINTGELITSKQAESLIAYAVESKCEHFAITGTFCQCEDRHLEIGNTDVCHVCGKPIIEKVARTVGFFTPVHDWSPAKQEYDHKKRHEFGLADFIGGVVNI